MTTINRGFGLGALLFLLEPATLNAAEPITAVFSSERRPYQEALKGLEEELGRQVKPFFLSQGELPNDLETGKVILAFGSKAAMLRHPSRSTLIYAMAPGTQIQNPSAVKILMTTEPSVLLSHLRRIQPGLRRLGVITQTPGLEEYLAKLKQSASSLGMSVESASLASGTDLPDLLRALYGRIDALWLPPDPLLLNANNLSLLFEFSRANKVPLYVPTAGIVEQGATASIGPSFQEIGRLTGQVARRLLQGEAVGKAVTSSRAEVIINKGAAAQVGLALSPEALSAADKVLP